MNYNNSGGDNVNIGIEIRKRGEIPSLRRVATVGHAFTRVIGSTIITSRI